MTGDLITWLRAQLDTDERIMAEYEQWWSEELLAAGSYVLKPVPGWGEGEPLDPARVLAEVDAKRRILDRWAELKTDVAHWLGVEPDAAPTATEFAYSKVARLLALPYAGRFGYQEAWRP